ncbi:serine hydrolase [Aquimarina sp. AU119]|uniref:serine hydrolase domain-containing protein n=1 Tax=Aquimarina sp. AU119 TaxID=2108528 RepID=UPI001359BB74|nr:serine hydrolase [Aquimarina sp. AU119]
MNISVITKQASFFLLFACCQNTIAQNIKVLVDSIAKVHFQDSANVGLSIGIIENDSIREYYYGGKYVHNLKDIDSATLFEIGSVTKLYTSFILASLETENKISRFDLLSKYLPQGVTDDKLWGSKVRLVDLATHTSGLPQFESTKSLIGIEGFDENDPYGLFTEDFMLDILKKTDTLNNYGKIRYSNFGIGLLGYAMAKSQNTSFSDLFMKYIVKNQGLESTYLSVPERYLTDIAIPHRKLEKMPLIHLAGMSPSGSIKTSMPDLLSFLDIHLKKPVAIKNTVELVLENQLKNNEQAVGLGWGIHTIQNETMYFHNGGTYGSSSIVLIVPSKMIGVAILSNNSSEGQLTSFILKLINKLID